MSKETGGPAFPNVPTQGIEQWSSWDAGMTLRDYFAAKALATIAAYEQEDVATWDAVDFAKHAYGIADAMLAARTQS